MRNVSLTYNLLLAFVIFLGGQLLGAGQKPTPNQSFSPEGPQLHLRAGAFDPLETPLSISRAPASGDQLTLRLVQFTGPVQDDWLESLGSCGLEIVGYVPDYAFVVWGTATALDCLGQSAPLRWYGLYSPVYALHPSLEFSTESDKPEEPAMVDVIIQLYETPDSEASVQAILEQAVDIKRAPQSLLGYRALGVRLEQDHLAQIAGLPGVVNIEPLPRYTPSDEVQGQIIAGNLTGDKTRPSGPGYLAWLAGLGFSLDPEDYPIVDVTDDGIDDGSALPVHADFYQFGDKTNPDRLIYNYDWTSDHSAAGIKGHGNLNASIVAGYNNLSGAEYKDGQGYHYGLGINPFGRVAGSKVFSSIWGWELPNSDFRALINNTYLNGGRISTNSWGSTSSGSYTWDDQTYDALVRDAVEDQPANQEIAIIFSAGNNGPWPTTTGSPGNAKNVLTVGAAESYRPSWTDGCGIGSLGADDAGDIAEFSSRGPTADGRMKPDLVAPGTHIQGAASQVVGYSGEGICDGYHPIEQTLYAASSGTSHAAPAVAGAASLLYAYFQQHFSAEPPSPAMLKAYLTNSARYLDGIGANDTLPSSSQGSGEIDLGRAFDGVARSLVDQQVKLTESGQLYLVEARVQDSNQPLRITLAWSDAPGSPFAAAYVNNLDLEVEIGAQTYLGNVFSGSLSTSGGQADAKNNLESVYLPAGTSGPVLVRVRATNIAGDGVPNNLDLTDQDFALVIYNAVQVFGTLQGMVTDQATGAGLSDAAVLASSTNWQYGASTDATGLYTLTLPANTYTVSAWKYGYSQDIANDVLIIQDQSTFQNFSLSSVPTYQLTGCVTDQATNQGLAAILSLSSPYGDLITQTLTTRANPCYDLDLYAASYLMRVESLLHFPGETQVNLDRNRVQDFSLEATTLNGLIHGRVTDFNSAESLSGVELSFDPQFSALPTVYQTITGSDGVYEILLPPDTYTASVQAPLYATLSVGDVVIPQSNVEERDFTLRSPHMSLSPSEPLRFDLEAGEQDSATLILGNNGSSSLDFLVYESTGDSYSAGPDPAGYLLLDSRVSDAARYEWIDASDGAIVILGDDAEITLRLPFLFTFYDRTSDVIRIANNGAALFDMSEGQVHYNNQALSIGQDYLIAPYWDDLDSDDGWVSYKTVGSAPERRFVVEWYDRPHFNNGDSGITFELILYEGSNNLKFQYKDVYFNNTTLDQGKSATVGIRGRGKSYLESSYNQPALVDSMALCFQAAGASPCDVVDFPWLTITPEAGSLNALNDSPISIQVNAESAGLGVHSATIRIRGNDPLNQPYLEIPFRLVVHGYDLHFPFIGWIARPPVP